MALIDNALIFFYMAALLVIGIYANHKQKNVDDYYVAGRRQGTISIACLWLASWIGGASIIGSSGKAYETGVSAVWYVGAVAIGLFLFGLLAARRAKILGDQHQFLTFPDLIEHQFDSRTRVVVTLTTIASYIAFSAGQLAAAASVLHVLLGWDFSYTLLLATGVVVLYTATGGYLAVAWTDWVQLVLLLIGVLLVGFPIAIQLTGNFEQLTAQLPESYSNLGAWGWPAIIAMVVSMVLSFFTSMDCYSRSFAAKSAKAARNGALLAVLFVLPLAVAATWMGMTTAVLFPGITENNNVLPTFVMEMFPDGFKGLMLVGVLAAIMSTADICILTASANITNDIYERYINPDISQKNMLRLGMLASLLIGFLSALMAWKMQDVLDILLIGFTLNSAAVILPSIAALYAWKVNAGAAFWSICLSFVTVLAWYAGASLELSPVFEVEALWPGLAVATISFFSLGWRGRQSKAISAVQAADQQ
ncbi:MAG TPA: sodium:solute symporter family protein [Xanthomonadales bacterium]|nr:sodium:solute symporter family protein [Xanthomonadales bacterium]